VRPLVHLRGVEKSVPQGGGRLFLLRRIDLEVAEGDFVSVMGPSGAGKTTLLNILGLHDDDFTGEYELDGQAAHRLPRGERMALQKKTVGFVFQSYHLLDDLTVAENLDLPLSYRGIAKGSARPWWPTPSTASRSWARRTSTRRSSPADSSSWWRWPAR
jgi:ABC-type lipoprotein export system ATPase subunit